MASPAQTFVSVKEYLHSVYRPDLDYVDGRLEDRSSLQMALLLYFHQHRFDWNIRVVQSQRMQISATLYRMPDTLCHSEDPTSQHPFVNLGLAGFGPEAHSPGCAIVS